MVDQDAADAFLPEFAEQAGGIDIGDAVEVVLDMDRAHFFGGPGEKSLL